MDLNRGDEAAGGEWELLEGSRSGESLEGAGSCMGEGGRLPSSQGDACPLADLGLSLLDSAQAGGCEV